MTDRDDIVLDVLRSIQTEAAKTNEALAQTNAELAQTNAELAQTNAELAQTNARLDQTNQRLDFLAKGQIQLRTTLVETKQELRAEMKTQGQALRKEVAKVGTKTDRLDQRFEHSLHPQGDAVRNLEQRVARLEAHVEIPEP